LEPIYATATELARQDPRARGPSLELVDAHLARIEAVNPLLGAVVTTCTEAARARAREADAASRGASAGACCTGFRSR
jgi:Asp-tRNA(Asn)/Glu-tRNA(Gln) amidotransferase A subunit family amidase